MATLCARGLLSSFISSHLLRQKARDLCPLPPDYISQKSRRCNGCHERRDRRVPHQLLRDRRARHPEHFLEFLVDTENGVAERIVDGGPREVQEPAERVPAVAQTEDE